MSRRRGQRRAVVAGQPGLHGLTSLARASFARLGAGGGAGAAGTSDAGTDFGTWDAAGNAGAPGDAGVGAGAAARSAPAVRNLRRSMARWVAAGLVFSVAFPLLVGLSNSPGAAAIAAAAGLAWWAATTLTLLVTASLLTGAGGEPVDRLGVPNGLTAMRAYCCSGLATCAFAATPHRIGFIVWGTVGTVAAALDFFDGWLARHVGPITRFGQVLDPVMDCVFFSMAGFGNIALGIVPPWLGALILARYFAPLVIASAALLAGIRPPLTSTPVGKLNTALTGVVLAVLYPLKAFDGPVGPVALALGIPLLGTTSVVHWVLLLKRRHDAPVARAAGTA